MSTAFLTSTNNIIQYFDTTGNVAIGGTTPSSKLDVYGDVTVRSNLRVVAVSTLGSNVALSNSTGIANLYSSNVFVGINNSTPVCALDVNGSIRANSQSVLANKIISVYDSVNDPAGSSTTHWGFGLNLQKLRYQVPTGGTHGFFVNTTEAMSLNPSGFLGINNTNPQTYLDIGGSAHATYLGVDTGIFVGGLSNPISGQSQGSNSLCIYTSSTSSNANVSLVSTGGVGNAVGVNFQPDYSRAGGVACKIASINDASSSPYLAFYTASNSLATQERMRILGSSGFVGINTTTPAYQLDVNGSANITGAIVNTGFTNMSNSVVFSSNTSVWASNTAISASNKAYSVTWSSSANKLVKSSDTSNSINITLAWQNAYLTNNSYHIVLETTQNIGNQTAFGSKKKRIAIGVSNSQIAYDSSGDIFGSIAPATSLSLAATASNTTSITLSSSTNWVTSGVVSHIFAAEIVAAPTLNIGTITLT